MLSGLHQFATVSGIFGDSASGGANGELCRGKRLKRLSRNMQNTVGDLTHITSEMVSGNRIVKSFGGETYERQRFKESSLENRKQYRKLIMTVSINNPLMQMVLAFALSGMMYLALIII